MNQFQAELYHYGIKGQKHGVRRFQNDDGSLTEAGKRRYSIGGPAGNSAGKTGTSIQRNNSFQLTKENLSMKATSSPSSGTKTGKSKAAKSNVNRDVVKEFSGKKVDEIRMDNEMADKVKNLVSSIVDQSSAKKKKKTINAYIG